MTTQPSSRKFIEEFYGFPKRPSVTDTIPLTKPIIKKREVDAGLTKREIRRETN
jgi:hypothetical protein